MKDHGICEMLIPDIVEDVIIAPRHEMKVTPHRNKHRAEKA
jgi:hypothetical protein